MKPILWQNKDKTIVLIDIPGSIAAAQGTKEEPLTHLLQSSKPLQKPFEIHATSGPKAASWGKANRQSAEEADALHQIYCYVLEEALGTVKSYYSGPWCLDRVGQSLSDETDSKPLGLQTKRRGLELAFKEHSTFDHRQREHLPADFFERIIQPSLSPGECCIESESNTSEYDYDHDHGSHLWTYTTGPATLTLTSHDLNTARSTKYAFRLPAKSLAFLGDCSQPQPFFEMLQESEPWRPKTDRRTLKPGSTENCPSGDWAREKKFAFILLDPPWPNRSVKRTHKTPGTSYSTKKLDDLDAMLSGLSLSSLLSEMGCVGIWITNKPAVRKLVLGLFDEWGLQLIEEWVWLKTTVHGEPSSPLRDTWNGKKPYEVLLIGKRGHADTTCSIFHRESETVKRKVLVGVPDLHSRKPCLQELIGELVGTDDAPVLEIFARYLVSGWWSWGNECLKYNWEGCWHEADEAMNI